MFVLYERMYHNVFKRHLFPFAMEEAEQKENTQKKSNFTEKIRENPWTVSTFILGILVAILLVTTFSGTLTGNAVSKDKAASNLADYAKLQGVNVSVNKVTEEFGLYSLDVSIDGKATSLYLTKDGKNIVSGLIPIIASSSGTNIQAKEVPKTDKPKVELFVMSYCPYGTQMEKTIIPVLNLLKDKIDFTLRFVSYSMHGQKEVDENTRQYCIQKEQNDKFINYLSCFLQAGDSASCLTSTGIDQSKLSSCVSSTTTQFSITKTADATVASGSYPPFDIDKALNQQYGVQGSPTLIINGVEAQPSSRSPEAVKGTICEAFSSVPTQCSQKLSTTSSSAGFGSGTDSSASSASCG